MIRVMLVDDHALVRMGFRMLLGRTALEGRALIESDIDAAEVIIETDDGVMVVDTHSKPSAARVIVEQVIPGRTNDARMPTEKEFRETAIFAIEDDPQNGWDTDQFPNSVEELTLAMIEIERAGGFTTGGFNFDAKVRRQSIDAADLFHGHIGGIDVIARALLKARVGDEVRLVTPQGVQEIEVLDVRYPG